jgi:hypothetical protein
MPLEVPPFAGLLSNGVALYFLDLCRTKRVTAISRNKSTAKPPASTCASGTAFFSEPDRFTTALPASLCSILALPFDASSSAAVICPWYVPRFLYYV